MHTCTHTCMHTHTHHMQLDTLTCTDKIQETLDTILPRLGVNSIPELELMGNGSCLI